MLHMIQLSDLLKSIPNTAARITLAIISKTKTCTIYANQRPVSVPRDEEKNAKNNSGNSSIRNNTHKI